MNHRNLSSFKLDENPGITWPIPLECPCQNTVMHEISDEYTTRTLTIQFLLTSPRIIVAYSIVTNPV